MKLFVLSTIVLLVGAAAAVRAQDLDASYQSLKDAQAKGDAAAVKKLAAETSALARKAAAEPAPEAADEKEAWTKRVEYAKDIDLQTEYALFALAVKSPPATMVDLLAALEAQNPKCKYLDEAYASYLYALSQTGQSAKLTPVAEKALANFPENTDLLLVLVNSTFAANQSERAEAYANRLVAAWGRKTRPEGVAESDFEKEKSGGLSKGYWVSGVVAGQRSQWSAADKNLRAALPYVKGNNAMMAPALFYLGLANYNLGKMTNSKAKILEGAKFSDECAAIPSDYAQQAWKNSANMKAEAGRMR
ncbi:MAG TPA: hypothetical protein VMB03_22960 [Bryobacteraceae bacterium]|nr:hypothetical protein [Bryobacteraceae bacterium]